MKIIFKPEEGPEVTLEVPKAEITTRHGKGPGNVFGDWYTVTWFQPTPIPPGD